MKECEILKVQRSLGIQTTFETKEQEIMNKTKKQESDINMFSLLAWISVGLGALIGFLEIIFFPYNCKMNELNVLGDLLSGTVGPLWALAGLFFIYVAFLGQKQQLLYQQLEIMLNRHELEYTRDEIAGQKEEMKQQNETLQQQKFENTFFQLLTLFNSIVNSMDLRTGPTVKFQGRDCFKSFYDSFRSNYSSYRIDINTGSYTDLDITKVIDIYANCYNTNKSDLSHYFRTLYHIFKFIDNSFILDKKQYTSIVRAQLSSYEQALLFYNCLHPYGKKFKPLIEKYSLFKNIDRSLLLARNHKNEYSPMAFGE